MVKTSGRLDVFVDTSALVAAFLSPNGAAGVLLLLHRASVIRIVISEYVLMELRRSPRLRPLGVRRRFASFLLTRPRVLPLPPLASVQHAARVISPKDAPILASAKAARVAVLVTWDKEFLKQEVGRYLKRPILLPGEFLKRFRSGWAKH